MLDNWRICLRGEKVLLVPYRRRFVGHYHSWMQDEWIREMTASEPLTMEEELEMQEDWRKDPKKCTFIVLAKSGGGSEMERMAGDVNLFFSDPDDPKAAEIEVMIAEPRYRRQGYAREAVSMMMKYGVQQLGVTRFYCKILEDNLASRSLFESLSYFSCNYVAAFREVEYQRIIADESVVNMIVKAAASMEVAPYDSDIGDEGIEQEMGKDA